MSDAPAAAASPSSRARLVVASQGLEIQHLQEQLSRKDREHHGSISSLLEEKANVEAHLAQQIARTQRLETQVQLLGERLREVEANDAMLVTGEANIAAEVAKTNKARDEMLTQLRDEVRALRIQNTSLLQERELVAERSAADKRRFAQLEAELAQVRPGGSSPGGLRRGFGGLSSASASDGSTQTGDAAAFATVEDILTFVARTQGTPEAEVKVLKDMIDLELELDTYHRSMAAQHASNAALAEEALARKVEAEVMRLGAEQDKFRSMVGGSSYQHHHRTAGLAHGSSMLFAHTPSAAPTTGSGLQLQHPSSVARGGLPSPVALSAPDVSPSTIFSGHSLTPVHHHGHHAVTAPAANFVMQQQEELAGLRTRLAQLQQRHEEVRGVKAWGTAPSTMQHVSPSRAASIAAAASAAQTYYTGNAGRGVSTGGVAYGAATALFADSRRRDDSPQPEEVAAAAYGRGGPPMPIPMAAHAGPLVTPHPGQPSAGHRLTKSAAEASRLAAPASVLDRMLRKTAAAS